MGKRISRAGLVITAAVLILAACAPAAATPTAIPATLPAGTIPSPSATTVWFPATGTPTPYVPPPPPPTPDQRPGIGQMLIEDNFDKPAAWQTGKSAAGVISVADNQLTLAISQPKGYLTSLRSEPVPANFYVEISAETNLCLNADAYGLVLRALNANDFYRLLLTCNGQLRLERVINGQASAVQDWMLSGQVPPGAPGRVTIGVWVVGEQMRVFLDDMYQFSARVAIPGGGGMGVFARSAGDTPLTVSFNHLAVYQMTLSSPPVTPTPTATVRALPTRMPTAGSTP